MRDHILELLQNRKKRGSSLPNFVYVYGGLCDLVTKLPSRELIVDQFDIDKLQDTAKQLKNDCSFFNVKVVFCTINPCSLSIANRNSGVQQHINFYNDMQCALNDMIKFWNNWLINLNQQSGLVTPFLSSWVMKVKKNKLKINYLMMIDGINPNNALLVHWIKHLESTLCKNTHSLANLCGHV